MGGKRERSASRCRGAAAVEFALVLPILLTLVLGIMEFGFIFYQQMSITNAAREGARAYAIHHADSGFSLTSVVETAATPVTGVSATSVPSGATCAAGTIAQVTVTKAATSLTGWFPFLNSMTLTGKGAMRCG